MKNLHEIQSKLTLAYLLTGWRLGKITSEEAKSIINKNFFCDFRNCYNIVFMLYPKLDQTIFNIDDILGVIENKSKMPKKELKHYLDSVNGIIESTFEEVVFTDEIIKIKSV